MAPTLRSSHPLADAPHAAGNGLIDRRALFRAGGALAGAAIVGSAASAEAQTALAIPAWMKAPGAGFQPYGQPSKFEERVVRTFANPANAPGTGSARTPLHMLRGTITPNGLHFDRSHSGTPDINPDEHRLLIHGLVRRPLIFTLEALARYPMESRIAFVECAGNSGGMWAAQPAATNVQAIHGLLSQAEWTGVKLSVLLEEAGVDPRAQWIVAEGADASGMSRSVPLSKAMDDAMVCLYQNGERVRPANGYPMRLLLPGYQGNMNVKWLRRIKVLEQPAFARDETSKYSILLNGGKSLIFNFPHDAKSVIIHPSPGVPLRGQGFYEISGLAWSGNGRVTKVEVSADGGRSWAEAVVDGPVLPKALTRFRMAWNWQGQPAVLVSRATDSTGYVQPTREALIAERGPRGVYHYNGQTRWAVAGDGGVTHVYA